MIETLLAVLLVAGVCAIVAWPLLRPAPDDVADGSREALEAAKQAKYREIRDAEIDFRAGKLTEDEWRATDAELRREATAILAEIDSGRAVG